MNRRIAVSTLVLGLVAAVAAAAPSVEYGPGGVRVVGARPGTRIAWMALVRQNHPYHKENFVVRGIEIATGSGFVDVDKEKKWGETAHALWSAVDVDELASVRASSPDFQHSQRPIAMTAKAGESTITIQCAVAEVMYVRGRSGVWAGTVGDGSKLDADGTRNGSIVLALASLSPYKGNPHPPDNVTAGDLVLVIDPYEIRSAQYEVPR